VAEFTIPPFQQRLVIIFKTGKTNAVLKDDSDNYELPKVSGGITNAAQRGLETSQVLKTW
jgi:hypothetical protein